MYYISTADIILLIRSSNHVDDDDEMISMRDDMVQFQSAIPPERHANPFQRETEYVEFVTAAVTALCTTYN